MAGLLDLLQSASNTIAGNVTGPVDGINWLLKSAGVPTSDAPIGGSEWMNQHGFVRPVTPSGFSLAGETLGLLGPAMAARFAPQIASGLLQGAENLAAPQLLSKQAGAIGWHGPNPKNNLGASELQDLISSQRYLDRDIVAQKIRDGNFNVNVTPKFNIDGEQVRAIQDGHHALEAAIRSGNKPNFIVNTPLTNDRVQLLKDGRIDDYLGASYHDSPWYNFATKRDLF